ncbi:glucosaminidase domain-containing protein [Mesorhizobium sp. LNJC403B00]|uniref:glycoside hydrolase family 73 protein n=1 Tax=Mesorhizobium sp. LNJC403B00 TaxID=1287280 RepID=UPI0003CE8F21|nr:glucosaminidase domain-containing protein [Mesorhizobium sp. LNJC403B00]ESX87050.1 hypothetical protein X754_28625 [Mesorhizobium sp. LNJC403B00]
METGKGMILDGADEQTDDTGELPGAQDQSAALAPLYEKIERALDGDRPVAALLADLSPETTDGLLRQAHAANASQLIGAGADISLASQHGPKAFASDGNYAGVLPGPEAFVSVYGAKEGGRQFAKFDQEVKAGKQAFDMRAMPDRQIKAQLLEAAANVGHSPDGQSRYQVTAAAAQQALEARRNDPAGQASKAFPQVNAAWRALLGQGEYSPAAAQEAIALSLAAQQYLGIEKVQPVPRSVLKGLGGLAPQDMKTKVGDLLAGTADPYVRLAMSRQFVEAGLLERPMYFGQPFSSDGLTEKSSGAPQLTPDERIKQPFQDDLPIDVQLANRAPDVFGNRNQAASEPDAESPISAGVDPGTAFNSKTGAEPFIAAFGVDEGIKQFEKGNGNFSAEILAAKGSRKKFVNVFYQAGKSLGLTDTQARLMAAQAAHETGNGRSVPGFNYFGIKANSSWKGATQLLWTHEERNGQRVKVKLPFRKYATLEDAIRDRIAVMKQSWPKANDATDIDSAIAELRHGTYGVYATASDYADLLKPYLKELP